MPRKAESRPKRPKPENLSLALEASTVCADVFEAGKIVAWSFVVEGPGDFQLQPAATPFAVRLLQGRGKNWWSNLHSLDRSRVRRFLESLTADELPASIEFRLCDSFGSSPWMRLWVKRLQGRGSKRRLEGFLQDIQVEKEFQLESLRVSEREQNRIGQDLHDDLCQVLAGVSCLIRVTESKLQRSAPEEVPFLQEINQQVIEAMHRTRALTHGLFPGKVQISDIRGALLELASQMKTRFGVEMRTEFKGRFPKHSSGQIIQIFRIAQEACSNAVKHGNATAIVIHLEPAGNEMKLTLKDNGSGLGKNKSSAAPGVGLQIMEFRAGILGGEISIANNPEGGVSVCLTYPFES